MTKTQKLALSLLTAAMCSSVYADAPASEEGGFAFGLTGFVTYHQKDKQLDNVIGKIAGASVDSPKIGFGGGASLGYKWSNGFGIHALGLYTAPGDQKITLAGATTTAANNAGAPAAQTPAAPASIATLLGVDGLIQQLRTAAAANGAPAAQVQALNTLIATLEQPVLRSGTLTPQQKTALYNQIGNNLTGANALNAGGQQAVGNLHADFAAQATATQLRANLIATLNERDVVRAALGQLNANPANAQTQGILNQLTQANAGRYPELWAANNIDPAAYGFNMAAAAAAAPAGGAPATTTTTTGGTTTTTAAAEGKLEQTIWTGALVASYDLPVSDAFGIYVFGGPTISKVDRTLKLGATEIKNDKDNKWVFGGIGGLGVSFPVSEGFSIAVEGKAHYVGTPTKYNSDHVTAYRAINAAAADELAKDSEALWVFSAGIKAVLAF